LNVSEFGCLRACLGGGGSKMYKFFLSYLRVQKSLYLLGKLRVRLHASRFQSRLTIIHTYLILHFMFPFRSISSLPELSFSVPFPCSWIFFLFSFIPQKIFPPFILNHPLNKSMPFFIYFFPSILSFIASYSFYHFPSDDTIPHFTYSRMPHP